MAIIYTYPTKATPIGADLLLMSDSVDNKTKQATISSIKDTIDVVDSLSAGSGISLTGSSLPTGDITIANTGVLSISSANTALTASGSGAITLTSTAYGGGATIGHVPTGGSATTFLKGNGSFSTVNVATDVTGIIAVGNGGLGTNSFTTGDILYASGGSIARLSIGTAGQVLKVNSGATAPEWAAASGGVVTSYTNGTDNRVLTSSGATTINGESNFTFTGSDLALSGQFVATAGIGANVAIRGIASNSQSTQGWNANLGVANFDQNDTGANCTTIAVNTESTNGKLISFYYQENSGTGPKGEIKFDTSSGEVQYNVTSDYRLKENVLDLSSAIDRVKNLKPKRFNFIGNSTEIDGFLAHEVQEVVPQAVSGIKDQVFEDGQINPQQMDASKLIPVLTAAIKELTARIEALEG